MAHTLNTQHTFRPGDRVSQATRYGDRKHYGDNPRAAVEIYYGTVIRTIDPESNYGADTVVIFDTKPSVRAKGITETGEISIFSGCLRPVRPGDSQEYRYYHYGRALAEYPGSV